VYHIYIYICTHTCCTCCIRQSEIPLLVSHHFSFDDWYLKQLYTELNVIFHQPYLPYSWGLEPEWSTKSLSLGDDFSQWQGQEIHILGRIVPTDELIFFRGVGIPPISFVFCCLGNRSLAILAMAITCYNKPSTEGTTSKNLWTFSQNDVIHTTLSLGTQMIVSLNREELQVGHA